MCDIIDYFFYSSSFFWSFFKNEVNQFLKNSLKAYKSPLTVKNTKSRLKVLEHWNDIYINIHSKTLGYLHKVRFNPMLKDKNL